MTTLHEHLKPHPKIHKSYEKFLELSGYSLETLLALNKTVPSSPEYDFDSLEYTEKEYDSVYGMVMVTKNLNDTRHSTQSSALIHFEYDLNLEKSVITDQHYCHGLNHRVGGPATTNFNSTRENPSYDYALYGFMLSPENYNSIITRTNITGLAWLETLLNRQLITYNSYVSFAENKEAFAELPASWSFKALNFKPSDYQPASTSRGGNPFEKLCSLIDSEQQSEMVLEKAILLNDKTNLTGKR